MDSLFSETYTRDKEYGLVFKVKSSLILNSLTCILAFYSVLNKVC